MIPAIALLLICQLAGEALVRLLEIPLPGPVVGLVLLALGLLIWRKFLAGRAGQQAESAPPAVPKPIHDAAHGILRNLSLLFVPAAVGIVQQADVLATHGVALIAALVVSTVAAMVVTALTFRIARKMTGQIIETDSPSTSRETRS